MEIRQYNKGETLLVCEQSRRLGVQLSKLFPCKTCYIPLGFCRNGWI